MLLGLVHRELPLCLVPLQTQNAGAVVMMERAVSGRGPGAAGAEASAARRGDGYCCAVEVRGGARDRLFLFGGLSFLMPLV